MTDNPVSGSAGADGAFLAEQRRTLALREYELLAALVAGGAVPAGFDATRVRAQAAALVAKKRSVEARARHWRRPT